MQKLKNWLLKKYFVKELENAKFEGSKDAFAKALEDLEETNVYNTDEKAKELMEKRLNAMLSLVDVDKIVSINKAKGLLYIGGKQADDVQLSNLRAEAEFFVQSELWKLIKETPKELAQKAMFVSGETIADLNKGRAMLYTLSTQQNIVDILRSLNIK